MTLTLPPRFINWRIVGDKKKPCRPDGDDRNFDPHDVTNHLTYEQAATSPHPVGFALRAEDGLFFLDLDKCRTDAGWSNAATAIWQSFGGAMGEVSQSGNGLHIIGRCDPSKLTDRRNKWDGWLEFYTDRRFIAFGQGWAPIGGTYTDKDWTDQLLRVVPQREFLGELPDGRDPAYTGPEDDDMLIGMMLRSKSTANAFGAGVTIRDLWEANADALAKKYPAYDGNGGFDHSSADAALMSHLAFWTGKDMPRMDRLFRRSALMRDKYEKRDDYRRDTIQNAARLCKQVYDRKPEPTLPGLDTGDVAVHDVFLTVHEMQPYFSGCVYIRDSHRVLVPDGALLKPEQFNSTYGGHVFQMMPDGTKPTTEAFKALTQCAAHRFPQAKRACFRPDRAQGELIGDEVNVYVDPQVDATPGDVTRFLDFLSRLLPHEQDRQILLAWCAAAVQNPGAKFQWAPVLQGTEGNGKSLVASCLAYALGQQYAYEPRASQLASQFISFDEHMLLIIVEELHMNGRRELLDELKARVTNRRVEVEAKGQDKRLIINTANWFFCTNYKDAVIKSKNDRRYAIFFTAQQTVTDLATSGMTGSYFPDLYRWLRSEGGYAAITHFLRNYPIPAHLNPADGCHRAPETTSTQEAIAASMGGVEYDILEAIEEMRPGFRGGWVSSWALDKLLEEKRHRISGPKRGEILRGLGYTHAGRASVTIFAEGGSRPNLWVKPGVGSNTEGYLAAQSVGGVAYM